MSDIFIYFYISDAESWAITPIIIGIFVALVLSISSATLSKRGVFDK